MKEPIANLGFGNFTHKIIVKRSFLRFARDRHRLLFNYCATALCGGMENKMKKIISAILMLTCLAALCSCSLLSGLFGGGDTDFEKAIKNTNPSKVHMSASVETSLGTLVSEYEMIYNEDGSAVIKYSYEKFNEIGADEIKSTVRGTINRAADGTYSGDTDGFDPSSITEGIALDISAIKEDAMTVNEAGDVLTALVAAEDTAAVFGSAYDKDVNLEITVLNEKVTHIELSYEGASISCRYE